MAHCLGSNQFSKNWMSSIDLEYKSNYVDITTLSHYHCINSILYGTRVKQLVLICVFCLRFHCYGLILMVSFYKLMIETLIPIYALFLFWILHIFSSRSGAPLFHFQISPLKSTNSLIPIYYLWNSCTDYFIFIYLRFFSSIFPYCNFFLLHFDKF